MKKKIALIILIIVTAIILIINSLYIKDDKVEKIVVDTSNKIENIILSEETILSAEETVAQVENGETLETTEPILEDSYKIENELEQDAMIDQENISYNGDIKADGLKLLGAYQGLTYYSQADTRWTNQLYTSSNNKTQTMKSSGCGPTACAMVVTASKGTILPTTMAKLFVDNGYRTKSNGTAWSAFSFTADYFGFKEFHTTANYNTAMKYLDKGYYVISACGNGLFTTSGHYILLTKSDKNNIQVYDPYLYSRKI